MKLKSAGGIEAVSFYQRSKVKDIADSPTRFFGGTCPNYYIKGSYF
jgi:hypothetical protein